MNVLPIFRDESRLPTRLAGLDFEGVHYYPQPGMGVSVRYGGPGVAKADAYLYDLGLTDVPTDLKSERVVEWFREACGGVFEAARRGVYSDLEVRASQFLHLPADAPEPFALWASFVYAQAPAPGVGYTGKRVSNLALRTDHGQINKVRYTYPDPGAGEAADAALAAFLRFLVEWTDAVRLAGE